MNYVSVSQHVFRAPCYSVLQRDDDFCTVNHVSYGCTNGIKICVQYLHAKMMSHTFSHKGGAREAAVTASHRISHNAKGPGSSALVVRELLTSSHFTDSP